MAKGRSKSKKPRDRFDEVIEAVRSLDRKIGLQFDDLKHQMSLVAEQVAHNTGQISKIDTKLDRVQEDLELTKYGLKVKADNVELISLSRRVTILERKLINRK